LKATEKLTHSFGVALNIVVENWVHPTVCLFYEAALLESSFRHWPSFACG